MHVRDLIALLHECDPDADVVLGGNVYDVTAVDEIPANEWVGAYVVIR